MSFQFFAKNNDLLFDFTLFPSMNYQQTFTSKTLVETEEQVLAATQYI